MRTFAIILCISLVFLLKTEYVYSQNNDKPKVAVVLSGGGAKGIAHIPLLQTLDSSLTTYSNYSASIFANWEIATTSALWTCFDIASAASNFLLIKVSIPLIWDNL